MKDNTEKCDLKAPLDVENEFKIRRLENRIKALESAVRVLTIITDKLVKVNGLKVERYTDLLVIDMVEE